MKAYYILTLMIIVLSLLFLLLPSFLKKQNKKMAAERKYHEIMQQAVKQNLDIAQIKLSLADILPAYYGTNDENEILEKLKIDLNYFRKRS